MNKRLINVLKDAVECRCRPNIDDIDAQNILFMLDDLTAERDAALAENAAYYQLAKKEVWAVAESALREAKEALVMNIVGTGGRTPAAHNAIATINKVLGE